jgi:hypothetical protein
MIDIAKALHDPSSVFKHPADVLSEETIETDDKIKILKQWEYDARELLVASEEGMVGDTNTNILYDILEALHQLGVSTESSHSTKHGGD